jgi:prepilin-type N-terminal cleavage/methylation domain-containing protein/prepilin-type processing-associated H-X9-DG protein
MTCLPDDLRRLRDRGFTLLEVLVTIGSIGLLLGLLVPGFARARGQARATVCASNIRQLASANAMYTVDFSGVFAPGAADFLKNRHRWHGVRRKLTEPFEPQGGPLVHYLGEGETVRACPDFVPESPGFERGNGGYGYNNAYVGVQTVTRSKGGVTVVTDRAGAGTHQIRRPAETIMFTDAAFVSGTLIEYSFAEPRFHPQFGTRADPSIHFRHHGAAHAAWCDGHVSAERRTFSATSGLYAGDPARHDIGWFGPSDDNALFDLQ